MIDEIECSRQTDSYIRYYLGYTTELKIWLFYWARNNNTNPDLLGYSYIVKV